jgi:predicted metal-dependent HD superfamily phosphohydrolase
MVETQAGAGAAAAWTAAGIQLGGSPQAVAEAAADLARRYAEPHRHYHDAAHVDAVVRYCALLAADEHVDEAERAVVTLAACAHDVVYDARPGKDEEASAEWAHGWLSRAEVPDAVVERVAGLVRGTATHTAASGDVGAAVLFDADLAVLGGSPADYARYVAAVRVEYAGISDADWRVGRARVLGSLAARNPIYVTESAQRRWEATARLNLAAELRSLAD